MKMLVTIVIMALMVAACGSSGPSPAQRACSKAKAQATADTKRFFDGLPHASQAYRSSFHKTALKIHELQHHVRCG
jgi:outer membrane PBP1 activator LpoA protein